MPRPAPYELTRTSVRPKNFRLKPGAPLRKNAAFIGLGQGYGTPELRDSSGRDNHVPLTDVAWTHVPELRRNGQIYNGTTAFGTLPASLHTSTWTEATYSVWLKLANATPVASRTGLNQLTGINPALNENEHYPWVTGTAYLNTFRADRKAFALSSVIDREDWHRLTITTKAGGTWSVWQNTTQIYSTAAQSTVTVGGNGAAYLGRSALTSGPYCFDGQRADEILLPRWVSPAEIAVLCSRRPDLNGNIVGPRLTVPQSSGPSTFPYYFRNYVLSQAGCA